MKTDYKQNFHNVLLMLFCLIGAMATTASASVATEKKINRSYSVAINLFTIKPDAALNSYRAHGSGNVGESGNVGLASPDFRVYTKGKNKKGRFLVNVSFEPHKKNSDIKVEPFEVDLTDMQARSFELTKNKDGSVCILNLTPTVKIIDNRPKRANDTAFKLSRWTLSGSMVIFNDTFYVGKMGCSGGPLAFVSYPGIATIEFALEPFKGAKPLGTLKNGRIQIHSEDGQSLDIYGVKNGIHEMQLPGGPYEVWVRWNNLSGEPKFEIPAKEEWLRMVKAEYAKTSNTPPTDEELDKTYERVKNQKRLPLSYGVGPIKPKDRIKK